MNQTELNQCYFIQDAYENIKLYHVGIYYDGNYKLYHVGNTWNTFKLNII